MKKVVGILLLCFIMIANISFATTEDVLPISEIGEYDIMPISKEPVDMTGEGYEMINDDVYKMEKQVTIHEIIDGNVYVMAREVRVDNAVIYGNLFVMAEEIEIVNSEISGSVFAMGEKISFSGITNDLYACGSKVDMVADSYVWRSAKVAGETINMNGNVGRNLYAGVNQLNVGDTAKIEGTLQYFSAREGNISDQAQIQNVQFTQDEQEENTQTTTTNYVYEIANIAFQTLLIALVIVFLVGKFKTLKRTDNLGMDFLKSTGKGALMLIFVPILSVVLMLSILGLGFGMIILALYIILLCVAIPITSVEIAYRILGKKEDVKKAVWIGISILVSLVIWGIKFIPVVGGIVRLIVILIGLGIVSSLIFQRNKKEKVNEN